MNERMTKRDTDGQAMMDCEKCKADWTGKHGKPMADCTALYCRNRLLDRLAAYEDTGLTPEEIKAPLTEDAMINLAAQALGVEPSRLRELAEADKDGRVVVMPCKFGDKLYRVFGEEIQEFTVSNIKYMGLQHRWSVDTTPFILYAENLIGTELFLAREEAARAIQEMEGKKDGV